MTEDQSLLHDLGHANLRYIPAAKNVDATCTYIVSPLPTATVSAHIVYFILT